MLAKYIFLKNTGNANFKGTHLSLTKQLSVKLEGYIK